MCLIYFPTSINVFNKNIIIALKFTCLSTIKKKSIIVLDIITVLTTVFVNCQKPFSSSLEMICNKKKNTRVQIKLILCYHCFCIVLFSFTLIIYTKSVPLLSLSHLFSRLNLGKLKRKWQRLK